MTAVPGRFALDAIEPVRWRNGAGLTRMVAIGGDAATPDWRISVAELDAAAPFSAFDGMDRVAVLVAGERLVLRGDDGPIVFGAPDAVARFAGEARLAADAPAVPARLWNAMARRGRASVSVAVHEADAVLAPADVLVAFAVRGRWRIASADGPAASIGPGEGLRLDAPGAPSVAAALEPGALLVVTSIALRGPPATGG